MGSSEMAEVLLSAIAKCGGMCEEGEETKEVIQMELTALGMQAASV
jgi:hypothetical protein